MTAMDGTALHEAIERQDVALVRALLDGGVDPDARACRTLMTPLQRVSFYDPQSVLAVPEANTSIVSLLLSCGADPLRRGCRGQSAYDWAVLTSRISLVDEYLAVGVTPWEPSRLAQPHAPPDSRVLEDALDRFRQQDERVAVRDIRMLPVLSGAAEVHHLTAGCGLGLTYVREEFRSQRSEPDPVTTALRDDLEYVYVRLEHLGVRLGRGLLQGRLTPGEW